MLHDLVPKDNQIVLLEEEDKNYYGIINQLNLSNKTSYPMWQIICREAIAHVKSRDFRDQFYKLIRNEDIHVRLASLHLFLLADRVKTINAKHEKIPIWSTARLDL